MKEPWCLQQVCSAGMGLQQVAVVFGKVVCEISSVSLVVKSQL